jgi:hypothetical protein
LEGVTAGLLLASTFSYCWRHRCRHKTTLALLDKLGELREKDP